MGSILKRVQGILDILARVRKILIFLQLFADGSPASELSPVACPTRKYNDIIGDSICTKK